MSGTDKFITVNGARLHYVEHGKPGNQTFLYLTGASGAGHDADLLAARISDRYHVLALTQRGHGDSDRSESYEGMTFVEDTTAFIEATGSAPAIVCGLSMGGAIGLGLAALHPDKVAKLIDVDSGPAGNPEGRKRIVDALKTMPDGFNTMDELITASRVAFQGVPDEELRRCLEFDTKRGEDGKLRRKTDPEFLRFAFLDEGGARNQDGENALWAACAMIQCPTLIVRGSRSDILRRETAERMLSTIANAQLVEVDSEHAVPHEDPAGFYAAIKDFI